MQSGDTIVAISSSVTGSASRIIVRLSGPDSSQIVRHVFALENPNLTSVSLRRLRFRVFPEFVAWVYQFNFPHSVTGEDVLELHLLGNALLAKLIVDDLIRAGARQAEPGEFTARAFFNGKLDLTEAEGVAAVVSANSQAELSAARQLLAGELARRLTPIMDAIARALALVEAGIDFVDEGISFVADAELIRAVDESIEALREILRESSRFERLSHEPQVALAGRPNAGKSTLLNALAGYERAVVSPVAGTTRDALRATVKLPRGLIELIDAAGIDDAANSLIDRQMQSTASRAIESADLVILLRDCTDDRPALELSRPADLIIAAKSDLPHRTQPGQEVSAKTGAGIEQLRDQLDDFCFGRTTPDALAISARHVRAIEDAIAALTHARDTTESGAEFIALELRESLDALGSILGRVSEDDVLGKIFASFCIGK